MSNLIINCEKELIKLYTLKNNKERTKLLKKSRKCLIKAISEIVHNCLAGNIPMTQCKRNKLKRYRKILKKLGDKELSLNSKRNLLVQKGSGYLTVLIPIALEVLSHFLLRNRK